MNKKRAVLILATISLVASLYLIYEKQAPDPTRKIMEEISVDETKALSTEEPKETFEEPNRSDEIIALKEINSDVLGIITIPGTNINYPVLKSRDNNDYLYRDLHKKHNKNGSVFLDYECNLTENSDNIILYGHNMKNTNMFSDLLNYRENSYFMEHDEILFYVDNQVKHYEVVGALVLDLTSEDNFFQFNSFIRNDESLNSVEYLEEIKKRAIHYKDELITENTKLITLSTCAYDTNNARFLIIGIEK